MDALLMCGGCGTRLQADTEKPLFEIAGRTMIDRILQALTGSQIERVAAVASPHTPETRRYLESNLGPGTANRESADYSIIDAPGEGYVSDLQYALDRVDLPVLSVAVDLPVLDSAAIDSVLTNYDGGSRTIAVPARLKRQLGVSVETMLEAQRQELMDSGVCGKLAPTGVNIVGESTKDATVSTFDVRFAINVNYYNDARVAEAFLTDTPTETEVESRVQRVRQVGREPHGSSDDVDLLDFSANTNPRVPEGIREIYTRAFDTARTYPTDPPGAFREAAAAYVDCEPEQVIPAPGGLAAIRRTIDLAVSPGDSALVPYPSFGEYAREVRLQGGTPAFISQDSILEEDPAPYALAIVCNPNNPTGNAYDPDELQAFAERCNETGTPLLVDEAFLGFTERSTLAGMDGAIVVRSLTKLFGLPGIRAGFAVATDEFCEALQCARRTWNLSVPAIETGTFCLQQESFITETRKRVRAERERLREALSPQFDVHESDAPFLLLNVGDRDVDTVCDRAREQGICLRDATTFRGLDSHVRIAIRLPAENDRLLEVLRDD